MGGHNIKPELRVAIRALVETGQSDRAIAAALGVTKNTVIGMRRRMDLASNVDPAATRNYRRGPVKPVVLTTMQRLDALEAEFNAILKKYTGIPRVPVPEAKGTPFKLPK